MSRKKILIGAVAATTALALTACSGGGDGEDRHLVMYSAMTDSDFNAVLPLLEEEFPGIDVELVSGSAGELTTRMQSESSNPQGDMMWGGLDTLDGDRYSDIFEHWLSEHEDQVEDQYKSPNGFYNVDHLSTAVFAVNTDLEEELGLDIQGYEDLLDPRLTGRILMPDPTASSSAWNNISNIMAVFGYDSDEAWEYIESLLRNDLVIASSSQAAYNSIADGEYAVGLTYEDGAASLIKNGADNLRLVYPEEGASASAFAMAVIEGGPNNALAKDVVNYLMSPEGQQAFGEAVGTVRMTTASDYEPEYLTPDSEINWVERDVDWLRDNRDLVIDKWIELYTETR